MRRFDEDQGLLSGYGRLGLSARRIDKHLHLGPINPFPDAIMRAGEQIAKGATRPSAHSNAGRIIQSVLIFLFWLFPETNT
jgi:hypothetical protein